jgi:DNA repair ATPase RecN
MYWLKGMAGTGKSIITRTFATAAGGKEKNIMKDTPLAENVCLGASFFFDRTKPDRNNTKRLFLTLAR